MTPFSLDILTPEKPFFKGECVSLVIPTSDGMMGILANHSPLTAAVHDGKIVFTLPDGTLRVCAVTRGMVNVASKRVRVLCESAIDPADIDVEQERLAMQGIDLSQADNPLKMFYDSLNLQPLPVSYTEDYVRFLPDFKPIPQEIASLLEFGGEHPKAITLPESVGTRLLMVASDEYDDLYSIWLYSLDDDYVPVDKLCLYAIEDQEPDEYEEIEKEEFIQYFSITSDYEIRLMDYTKQQYQACLEEVYHVDEARKFALASRREK